MGVREPAGALTRKGEDKIRERSFRRSLGGGLGRLAAAATIILTTSMLSVNAFDQDAAACLLDYFGLNTPWPRRLWAVGTVLSLHEVLEGSEAVQSGVLSPKAFENLCQAAEMTMGKDPGAGTREEKRLLQESLRSCPRPGSTDFLVIRQLLAQIEESYLNRWIQALSGEPTSASLLSPERVAQAIATHLMDLGFSETYLHPWWTFRIFYEPEARSLVDCIGDAVDLIRQTPRGFEILVPFLNAPGMHPDAPPHWLDPTSVSGWLRENNFDPRGLRQTGGLLLPVKARDVYAAVEQVSEIIDRLSARVNLGSRSLLQTALEVWIRGFPKPYLLHRIERGVEVRALLRENQMYTASPTSNIDAALELLGTLNEAPPGPAVASGWAALEALLLGPGDSRNRGIAGERLASLIACSYPRAELTILAHSHIQKSSDSLAEQLRAAPTNRSRVGVLAQALAAGKSLNLSSQTDRLAQSRMKILLAGNKAFLRDLEQQATRTLRRMYRQRNLVLHWGRMNAVCLRAALRTAAPLIGAGIDRIAHAWFASKTNPLELAARARIRLELLDTPAAAPVHELLDP